MPIFLAIGTDNIRQRFPKMTLALILINTVVYFASISIMIFQGPGLNLAEAELIRIEQPYIFERIEQRGIEDPTRSWHTMSRIDTSEFLHELREDIRAGIVIPKHSPEYKVWEEAFNNYQEKDDKLIFNRFGFRAARPGLLSPITHMFLHGGFWHLAWNMYFLWLVGVNLEDVWGRKAFLAIYLVGGLAAMLSQTFIDYGTYRAQMTSIGASGAVAAMMGAFMIRFYDTKIRTLFGWIELWVPAWAFLMVWIGRQLYYGIRYMDESVGIAFWAHIGGFAFGAVVAGVMGKVGVEQSIISDMLDKQDKQDKEKKVRKANKIEQPERPVDLELGIQARKIGRYDEAREHLERAAAEYPSNVEVHFELQQLYRRMELVKEANIHQAVLIDMLLEQGHIEDAVSRYCMLFAVDPSIGIPSSGQYQMARLLEERKEYNIAAEAYRLFAADNPLDELTPRALFQCGYILHNRLGRPQAAISILEYLLKKYPASNVNNFADQLIQEAKAKIGAGA